MNFFLINIGLAWDLIKSIRDPFESNVVRYRRILFFAPTSSILLMAVYIIIHELLGIPTISEENPVCGDYRFEQMIRPGLLALQCIFLIVSLYSLYVALKGLNRKGLNKEIRKRFLLRQFLYLVFVIGTCAPYAVYFGM